VSLKKIGKDYFYNLSLNVINLVFPLLTFPYSTRILGPDGIGRVNFAASLVGYLTFFSIFGIQVYGVREIAKSRDNPENLARTFSSLASINVLTSVASTLVYLVYVLFWYKNDQDLVLYSLFAFSVLFGGMAFDWLFAGTERFRYITVRSAIVKLISLPLLFLLVKQKSDYVWYAGVILFAAVGSSLCNIWGARKLFNLRLAFSNWKYHWKNMARFFAITIISATSVSLPPLFLGTYFEKTQVGFFSSAYKILLIILSLSNSLGSVLLPRLSHAFEADRQHFERMIVHLGRFINALGIPMSVGLWFLADRVMVLAAGASFAGASFSLRLMAPIIFLSMSSSFYVQQVLYPQKRESVVVVATFFTAVFAASIGRFLILHYGLYGANASYFLTELLLVVILFFACVRGPSFSLDLWSLAKVLLSSVAMGVFLFWAEPLLPRSAYALLPLVVGGGVTFGMSMWILREPLTIYVIQKVSSHLRRMDS